MLGLAVSSGSGAAYQSAWRSVINLANPRAGGGICLDLSRIPVGIGITQFASDSPPVKNINNCSNFERFCRKIFSRHLSNPPDLKSVGVVAFVQNYKMYYFSVFTICLKKSLC